MDVCCIWVPQIPKFAECQILFLSSLYSIAISFFTNRGTESSHHRWAAQNSFFTFLLCGLLNVLDQFICGSLYGSEWENVFFVFYVFYVFFCSKTQKNMGRIWCLFSRDMTGQCCSFQTITDQCVLCVLCVFLEFIRQILCHACVLRVLCVSFFKGHDRAMLQLPDNHWPMCFVCFVCFFGVHTSEFMPCMCFTYFMCFFFNRQDRAM